MHEQPIDADRFGKTAPAREPGGVRSCVGTRSASEECGLVKRGASQEGSGEQAIGLVPDMSMEAPKKLGIFLLMLDHPPEKNSCLLINSWMDENLWLMRWQYWFWVISLVVLCGCAKSTAVPKGKPQVLRTCLGGDIASLDPRKGVSMSNQGVLRMLFTGLVRLDENLEPSLELAESYRTSNDYKTYTFTLKKCFWSDGSPITAYDFERTWKAALTPAYSSACTNLFFYLKNGRKVLLGQLSPDELGVKAIDDNTLMIELEWANPKFLNILINSVFSPVHHTMQSTPPDPSHLICSGPFCLKNYAFQNQIILEKNNRYWNSTRVKLCELHYYIVKDPNTALMMFENKEIDWLGDPLSRIVPDSIPALRAKGVLHCIPLAGFQWMFINTDRFPLNNANIRKALAYALDRTTMMHELLYLEGMKPTLGLIPKIAKKERWHPWFVDNDVQKAQALFKKGLQELGLTADQFPAFSITYGSWSAPKIVQAIQQMWKKNLGIAVHIEQVDGPILFSRWYKRDYQVAWLSWVLQYNDPVNMLEIFKYKNVQPNCSGWENSDFIEHANASLTATSERDRWQHMEAAEKIFFDEMPSIPVNDFGAFYLSQPYVNGVSINYLYQLDFIDAVIDY